jgi:hypothetical protein
MKLTFFAFAAGALLFTPVLAPAQTDNCPSCGSIRGTVVGSRGEPVPDARVALNGVRVTATTDAAGAFSIRDVPPGPNSLLVTALGHAEGSAEVFIYPAVVASVTVRLQAPATPVRPDQPVGGSVGAQAAEAGNDTFRMTIVADGGRHPATFRRFSVRSPGLAVLLQNAAGGLTPFAPAGPATFLGSLDDHPDALAAAVVLPDGTVFHQVVFSDGERWINEGGQTQVHRPGAVAFNFPGFVVTKGATRSGVLRRAEVGVDMPGHVYRSIHAGNAERALRMVEYSLLGADLLYMRQVGIQHQLGRLVIRAAPRRDPYASLRGRSRRGCDSHCRFLDAVETQWKNLLPRGREHVVAVLHEVGGGGLASGSIASPRGYTSNDLERSGDFSVVWRHEAGHNWSLGHYDGGAPEGPTINSDNSLAKLSGPEAALVARMRGTLDQVLVDVGPAPQSVPPHAATDVYLVPASARSADIPVLDNDHDASGRALRLVSVRRVGGSLGGRASVVGDRVRFFPQTTATTGFAVFEYTVAAGGGRSTARGLLFVSQVDGARRYQQNFDAFPDGTTNLRDGSIITQLEEDEISTAVRRGALELTPDRAYQAGAFTVPLISVERGFTARFRYNVSSAGAAADAFAFNFGQRIPSASGPRYHGFARGITIEFNTYEAPGFRLFIDGVEQVAVRVPDTRIANGRWQQVEVRWMPNHITLLVDGVVRFDRVPTRGFVPTSQDGLAFSATNIGLSQRVLIDDIDITAEGIPPTR